MAAPHPSRAQLARENRALRTRLAEAERRLRNTQGEGEQALLTNSIDSTARQQAEADLQVALTKYRTLFDAFPLGITVSDATGKIVESNTMADRLLGLGRAEQRQRAIDDAEWQIVRPDGTPMPTEEYLSVRALREQHLVANVEMGVITPRGATRWINVTAAPLPLDDYGVVIAYSDITARRQAEAALRESQQNLEALIENTDGSIWSVDTQYRLIVGNRRFLQDASTIIGRQMKSGDCVLAPELPQAALDEWRAYYDHALHQGPFSMEATRRFTVEPHTIEYRLTPITTATGQRAGITVYGRDITARKHTEDALQQALVSLTQANTDLERQTHELHASAARMRAMLQEKEVLLKEIHHRVKNNLQVVVILLRLQSRQVIDAQAVAALRDSRQRVEVIALAHELLYRTDDLASIDAARYFQQLGAQLIQIYAATPNQTTLLVLAEGIGLSLNQAVPCGLIVSELIANSLKYAFPDGQPGVIGVDLRATSPDRLTLTVWDTGVGIAPNADAARPQSLGMTLVHDLVRQLRGSVVIANGAGVTVTITFPLDAASAQAADAR